jgi:ABC-type multidrug transport system fused ATPase/permease subunit
MPNSVYRYIWKVSAYGQIIVCLLSAVVIPISAVPLDLQRRMVDDAIGQKDLHYLGLLALLYLATILAQHSIKYALNLARGWLVEDVTRRLRNAIYASEDKRSADKGATVDDPGTVVSMASAEAEDIGGFVGDSISVPLLQGGTIIFVLGYLAWVDWRIASLAAIVYTPHYFIVSAVQQIINRLARGHAKVVRRIGHEIVAWAGSRRTSQRFRTLVDTAYELRMRIYRRKFLLTYLGNFLDALGPLLVLVVGGWFVIQDQAKVSTLVVFISGLQRIADPWDQLINFYRTAQIAQTKYRLFVQTLDGEVGSPSHRK